MKKCNFNLHMNILKVFSRAERDPVSKSEVSCVRTQHNIWPVWNVFSVQDGVLWNLFCYFVGRRHLQVRLVEPSLKSLNSGDCFALVTEKDLFSWIGKDCNPYEKAKVSKSCLLQVICIPLVSGHEQLTLSYVSWCDCIKIPTWIIKSGYYMILLLLLSSVLIPGHFMWCYRIVLRIWWYIETINTPQSVVHFLFSLTCPCDIVVT